VSGKGHPSRLFSACSYMLVALALKEQSHKRDMFLKVYLVKSVLSVCALRAYSFCEWLIVAYLCINLFVFPY
jgi:hypothetical protein